MRCKANVLEAANVRWLRQFQSVNASRSPKTYCYVITRELVLSARWRCNCDGYTGGTEWQIGCAGSYLSSAGDTCVYAVRQRREKLPRVLPVTSLAGKYGLWCVPVTLQAWCLVANDIVGLSFSVLGLYQFRCVVLLVPKQAVGWHSNVQVVRIVTSDLSRSVLQCRKSLSDGLVR